MIGLSIVAGCKRNDDAASASSLEGFAKDYANMVAIHYLQAMEKAESLDRGINAFLDAPSQETLDAARKTWREAREAYGPTEAFRFYGGPIDGEGGPEGLINAWPMDEAWLDYVEGAPEAGIIQLTNKYPDITRERLVSLNEQDGETNISTGYHAIEFLLWGQDMDPDGPGQRPVSDYKEHPNAERRATALRLLSALLVEQLRELRNAWTPDIGDYREGFLAAGDREAMRKALIGIVMLSGDEMAQERMYVAYESQDQEDEHSCFSDNTKADLISNQKGVRTVAALVVRYVDSEESRRLNLALDNSDLALSGLSDPFDKALNGKNEAARLALSTAVGALEQQTEALMQVAKAIQLEIHAP